MVRIVASSTLRFSLVTHEVLYFKMEIVSGEASNGVVGTS